MRASEPEEKTAMAEVRKVRAEKIETEKREAEKAETERTEAEKTGSLYTTLSPLSRAAA